MKLWPRIPLPRAQSIARQFDGLDSSSLRTFSWTDPANRVYAPTGGVPIDDGALGKFRFTLESLATESGYPNRDGRQPRAQFDDQVIKLLADSTIPFGEAVRAET